MQDIMDNLDSHEQAKELLEKILEKISTSNANSVIAETAPDSNIAEIVLLQLEAKGFSVSRYEKYLSVYIN